MQKNSEGKSNRIVPLLNLVENVEEEQTVAEKLRHLLSRSNSCDLAIDHLRCHETVRQRSMSVPWLGRSRIFCDSPQQQHQQHQHHQQKPSSSIKVTTAIFHPHRRKGHTTSAQRRREVLTGRTKLSATTFLLEEKHAVCVRGTSRNDRVQCRERARGS